MIRAAQALQDAVARLATRLDRAEAQRDARRLLQAATGWSGAGLSARWRDPIDADALARFRGFVAARDGGLSVAHVTGEAEFYGRVFAVGPGDLAPRPDTESLVDLALSVPFARLLDLGTGTGVLAVTLLAERPGATGLATEVAAPHLGRAEANRTRHGLDDRLELAVSDWFRAVTGRFDLIVSNPPYLSAAEHAAAPPEIALGERREALTPGGDGLDAYRAIARGAALHLSPGGRLMVEIGQSQGAAVAALFREAGLAAVAVHRDLAGKDRIVCAKAACAQAA